MSDLKVTVTVEREDLLKEKEIASRAGYCVALAYAALPYEMQGNFQHFGVRVWSHKHGLVTVDVKLIAWFPHRKIQRNGDQFQEYDRNFPIEPSVDMFLNDTQISHSVAWLKQEFLKALVAHIQELRSELVRGVDSVDEQLRRAVGAKETSL